MVQIFNPQALGDPGPTSALGGLSSTVASLLGQQNQQSADRSALLRSLITGGAGIGQQLLQNKGAMQVQSLKGQQDLLTLQNQMDLNQMINLGLIPGASGGSTQLLEQHGLNVTEQPITSAVLKPSSPPLFPGLKPDEQFTPDTGLQGQELTFPSNQTPILKTGLSAQEPIQGMNQQSSRGTDPRLMTLARSLTPDKFLLAASRLGFLPEGEKTLAELDRIQRENRIGAATEGSQIGKIEAESSKSKLELQGAKVNALVTDPEFLNGTVDVTGVPLNVQSKVIPSLHKRFALMTPSKRDAVIQNSASAHGAIKQFTDLGLDIINKRSTGVLNRQRLKLIASGKLDQFDELQPDEESLLIFQNQAAPLVIQTAGADQGANSISDKDRESIRESLGDPTASFRVFKNNFSNFTAKGYLNALRNTASVDASAFHELKTDLENLTGVPFNIDTDINDISGIAAKIFRRLESSEGVSVDELNNNQQAAQLFGVGR